MNELFDMPHKNDFTNGDPRKNEIDIPEKQKELAGEREQPNSVVLGALIGFIIGFGACQSMVYNPNRLDLSRDSYRMCVAAAVDRIACGYRDDSQQCVRYAEYKVSPQDEIIARIPWASVFGIFTAILGALIGLGKRSSRLRGNG